MAERAARLHLPQSSYTRHLERERRSQQPSPIRQHPMPKNITISVTNDGGLADPAPLIYVVAPPPLHDGNTVKTWPDSSPNANDALRAGRLSDDCPQGDTLVGMQDVQWWQFSQSFTAKGGRLHSAKFNLGAHAGATGNVFARLHAITGVSGSSAFPTGPPLASSEPVSAAVCYGWVEFKFTGANAIDMVAGTDYCIVVDGQLVTGAPIGIYYWAAGTHAGNMGGQLYGGNPWGVFGGAGADLPFKLYVDSHPTFKENVIAPGGWPAVRLSNTGDGFHLKNVIAGAGDWTLIAVLKPLTPVVGVPSFVMSSDVDNGPYAFYFDGGNPPTVSSGGRTLAETFRTYNHEENWSV